jgi:RimJ/RimL family protein N-acetyltransferase
MPEIETRRLRLRPMAPEDLPALARMFSDPDVMLYLPTGEVRSAEETHVELDYMVDHWRERGFGVWAVIVKETGEFAGYCGLQYLHEEPGGVSAEALRDGTDVEVVAGLGKPYWSQGIAPEATRAALRYGFETLRLPRIVAAIHPDNGASRHILTSMGMRLDAVLRYYGDCPHFVIRREEFQADESPYLLVKTRRDSITHRPYQSEDDFWRMRAFLREVLLLNGLREHSWPVPALDHWRWHLIENCRVRASLEDAAHLWETADGRIAAALTSLGCGELRMHVHPGFRSPELEDEMLRVAEARFHACDGGAAWVYLPVDSDDALRQEVLSRRGFAKRSGKGHKCWRDLHAPVPDAVVAPGYTVRSMGDVDEHPARSWASWRAFHSDEPDGNYDGDWSWFANLQAAPTYHRDLDIVAVAPPTSGRLGEPPGGSQTEIASFCTLFYDDCTRSAVCVLMGTAVEHQRRGLGKAALLEGFRRLRKMGCIRVYATGYDAPAAALYGSVMPDADIGETWLKQWDQAGSVRNTQSHNGDDTP